MGDNKSSKSKKGEYFYAVWMNQYDIFSSMSEEIRVKVFAECSEKLILF